MVISGLDINKVVFVLLLLLHSVTVGATPVKICGVNWPPSTIVVDGHIVKGYSVDVFNEAFKRIGVEFTLTVMPWKRCVKWVTSGDFDAVIDAGEANEGLIFGEYPNSFAPLAIFVREGFPKDDYIPEMLTGKSVGVVRGYNSYTQVGHQLGWNIIQTNDEGKMFRMLLAKRFDYAFSDILSTPILSKQLGFRVKALTPHVINSKFYLSFNPNRYMLAKKYDAVIEILLEEGVLDRIYKRYLSKSYRELLADTH